METRYLLCLVKIWIGVLSVGRRKVISQLEIICGKSGDNRTPPPGANSATFLLWLPDLFSTFKIYQCDFHIYYIIVQMIHALNLLYFYPSPKMQIGRGGTMFAK